MNISPIALACALACPVYSAQADGLLSDSFAGTTIDPVKWKVNAPGSSVTQNDGLFLQNGGMLISAAQFKPPLTVSGSFTFQKIGGDGNPPTEILSVAIRSDDVSGRNGIVVWIYVAKGGEDKIVAYNLYNQNYYGGQKDGEVLPDGAPGPFHRTHYESHLDISVNFTMVDDGVEMEFTIYKEGDEFTNFASLKGVSNFEPANNYICIANRGSNTPNRVNITKLNRLSVTSGTP